MHHALQIQEILLNIFGHCYWPDEDHWYTSDLASLAGTCRTFKEPALDVLWEELYDLTPLACCLPEVSRQLSSFNYSFSRSLTQAEWDVLRSYTRRIRSIQDFRRGLNEESLKILSNPPTTDPLFPNLCYLHCKYQTKATHLLRLPLPSLICLNVKIKNPVWFQDSLESFYESSPNIRSLSIHVGQSDVAFSKFFSSCLCRWRDLHTVTCPLIELDMDALTHLSCMPMLTRLSFMLSATFPASPSPLFFSNLHDMILRSESLHAVSWLLSWSRLPAITDFSAIIDSCPSSGEFSSFLTSVQTSNAGHTLKSLTLHQSSSFSSNVVRSEAPLLCFGCLHPFMAFSELRHIQIDIEWNVHLTDGELFTLASAWPKLEHFEINLQRGWNMRGGITPDGLLRLLQTCRSLSRVALAIDTRGYTKFPSSGSLKGVGLVLPCHFYLHVLDSIIEAESVPALATFFADITGCSHIFLHACYGEKMAKPPCWEIYKNRWSDVSRRVKASVGRHG